MAKAWIRYLAVMVLIPSLVAVERVGFISLLPCPYIYIYINELANQSNHGPIYAVVARILNTQIASVASVEMTLYSAAQMA